MIVSQNILATLRTFSNLKKKKKKLLPSKLLQMLLLNFLAKFLTESKM